MRKNYFNAADPFLLERQMDSDPLTQFDRWFQAILGDQQRNGAAAEEVNAAALSTVSRLLNGQCFDFNFFVSETAVRAVAWCW